MDSTIERTKIMENRCLVCGDIIPEGLQVCPKCNASDDVNHPAHYTDGNIEVIDFIEDKNLGFHLGNAIKYISRAGKKNKNKTVEDLQKAIWYINRYITNIGA